MSVNPPCTMFMYQREKYDTCCKFLLSKTNQSEWRTRLAPWQTLEYLHSISLFKTKDLSCVCVNYISEENWFPLIQGFQYTTTDSSDSNSASGDKWQPNSKYEEFQILMVLPNISSIGKTEKAFQSLKLCDLGCQEISGCEWNSVRSKCKTWHSVTSYKS